MSSDFFLPNEGGEREIDYQHDLYRSLNNDLCRAANKKKIEMLWREYEPLAWKNFLREAQRDFHQHWWEMYLTVGLLHLSKASGFKVGTSESNKGADVNITCSDGKCIQIEAIAPTPGDRGKPDSVPESKFGVENFPENELLLRLTSGLKEKRDKFKDYLDKETIKGKDACIIALSTCDLDIYGSLLSATAPAPLKVLAGIGYPVLGMNKLLSFSKRQPIEKVSKNTVPVSLFEDTDYDLISAVLYSSSDPLNAPLLPESTFQIFLNPLARVPLPYCFYTYIDAWNYENEVWKKIPAREAMSK